MNTFQSSFYFIQRLNIFVSFPVIFVKTMCEFHRNFSQRLFGSFHVKVAIVGLFTFVGCVGSYLIALLSLILGWSAILSYKILFHSRTCDSMVVTLRSYLIWRLRMYTLLHDFLLVHFKHRHFCFC